MLFPELAIGTSIAPKHIEEQLEAIHTWREVTDTIVSVNNGDEISLLRRHFPFVRFIEAKRNGKEMAGKPYIHINDILNAVRDTKKNIFAIINSDIRISNDQKVHQLIISNIENSFIYGQRIDVDNEKEHQDKHYFGGFDFFFFDREMSELFSETNFLLGVPWWDYWLPFEILTKTCKIKQLISPFAFHIKHETKWNYDNYDKYGRYFIELIKKLNTSHPVDHAVMHCINNSDINEHILTPLNALMLWHIKKNSTLLFLEDTDYLLQYFHHELQGAYREWHASARGSNLTIKELKNTIEKLQNKKTSPIRRHLKSLLNKIVSAGDNRS